MSDDRPLPSPTEELAGLRRDFEDFKTTILHRASRLPTGVMTLSFLPAPRTDCLFLLGQTLARADFPTLWAWIESTGQHGAGKPFGSGDGASTFVLPNGQGRMIMGAGTSGADTYTPGVGGGVPRLTVSASNLPLHTHGISGSIGNHGNHLHTFNTQQLGGHDGHFPGVSFNAAAGPDLGLAAWNSLGVVEGHHGHGGETTSNSAGGHSWDLDAAASGGVTTPTALDVRGPWLAYNVEVWT